MNHANSHSELTSKCITVLVCWQQTYEAGGVNSEFSFMAFHVWVGENSSSEQRKQRRTENERNTSGYKKNKDG